MAALNFPNSPSLNDTHTENGVTFKWNGAAWDRLGDIGAQGAAGAQGDTGSTGAQGSTGPVAGSSSQVVYKDGSNNPAGSANFTFDGTNLSVSGNVSIGGTLTYEDVTNIDSVGLITARNGLHVTGGNLGIGDANPSNELVVKSSSTPTIEINGQGRVSSLTLGVTANESKLFEGSNNALAFGTNNTERLRITSTGNIIPGTNNTTSIGDGTTNFASIWASTRFRGNDNVKLILGASQDLVIRHDGTNNIIGSPVGGDLHIKSGTGDNDNQLIAVFKHSNASVGIGTDNPSRILDVAGSISIASNLVQTTNVSKVFLPSHNSANRGGKIRFGLEDGSFGGIEVENVAGSNGSFNSQTVHLINHNGAVAGDIKSLTARFDGRIGIGSENPQVDLAVRSGKASIAIAKDGLTVKDSGDLHTSYDTIQIGAGGGLASYSTATATADTQFTHNAYRHSGGNWKYRYTDTAARLRVNSPGRTWIFESAASGNADADITFTEQLRITSDGDVKIKSFGNASNASADALQIGKTDNNYGITILSATNAQGRIDFTDTEDTNDPQGKIAYYHDTNSLQFFTNGGAASNERLRINQNGCLQVGEPTGTPSEVMQIRKASGDVEVIAYAAPGSKTIFNCTGSNRFALESGYNSVFEIQDPNGNGVRSDLRFDGNIILNKNLGEPNNSAVQLYRLIGPQNLSLGNGMAIVGGQTDTISTKAARIMTSNNNGTAWFGPYGTIHPGSYTAMFHMKVSNNSNTSTIIRIDVTGQGITDAGGYGDHRPRALNLAPSHFDNADRYQYIGLDFNFVNAVGSNIIEVRGLNFNNSRSADLYLDHILIVPRIPSHDG